MLFAQFPPMGRHDYNLYPISSKSWGGKCPLATLLPTGLNLARQGCGFQIDDGARVAHASVESLAPEHGQRLL